MEGGEGFTQLELLVVLCIMGVLTAMAWPQLSRWQKDAEYREAARDLACAMQTARSKAIASDLQHRIEVDLDEDLCRIVHGNRSFRSTASSWEDNVVLDWFPIPAGTLRANNDCSHTSGTVKITFNPLGSSNSQYLCVMDKEGKRLFRVGVGYSSTGKVSISRWDAESASWE